MKAMKIVGFAVFLSFISSLKAQKPVPYPYVREADVMWSKRVWEVIDLREKMNQELYYPINPMADRKSLFEIIKEGVLPGDGIPALEAYSAMDDEFRAKLSQRDLKNMFSKTDTVSVPDPNLPDQYVKAVVTEELGAADIKQYWIQEEWFFDKQRSVLDVRILVIMPVVERKNDKGETIGLAATFWISFPEMRVLLAKNKAFNRHNDAQRLSYDDVFIKRMFSSYIIKEDNPADRMIADYKGANTIGALLEGEAIRDVIRTKEGDMWQH
jgi:gliding motility associated protien GldN